MLQGYLYNWIMNKKKNRITVIALIVILVISAGLLSYTAKRPRAFWCPVYGGMTPELEDSRFYEDMISGKSFCFVGDSITYGTQTGGVTWYDPLTPYIKGDIYNYSQSGWTSETLASKAEEIPVADIYVVAIGINDVLFSDDALGAGTPEEYISNLEILTDTLTKKNPDARFYFITPWIFFDHPAHINELRDEFSNALINWCDDNSRICIDPYSVTLSIIESEGRDRFMVNSFHPNGTRGVGLFSYAVLYSSHQARIDGAG